MGASGDNVTPLTVKIMDITNEQICRHLYGYKTLKCLTPEEVCESFKKDQIHNGSSTEDLPPLSPRKLRVPEEISLCISSIPGEKFGACAAKRIPHGTWFGPFEGKLVRTSELKVGFNTEYMWEIYHDGEVSHFLDGNNENTWMAFVRCARHKKEQNLVVFQYHGCIYYRTTKDIGPRGELLVWYDNKYTQILGIPVAWNDSRNTNGKRKTSTCEESPKRRKEKPYPGLLLQKTDSKLNSPNEKCTNLSSPLWLKKSSPISTAPVTFKCEKCLFSFYTKEQLANHKCLSQSWIPTLRLPSLDRARDIYRPMHINMPSPNDLTYFYRHHHSFSPSQNFSYHSPPMDPLKQLPSAAHKGAPIAIRNF
ncbi:putative histone-lysine N-methyltransferase PRDM6 isoform X1 [Hydra vulgaris]|uniref:putative histone-lysine N-methyltransferase PRDM6 isoform X1 n=1 Tax=Hydra vulgaris TaxID=6087 RepID=UPI000640CB9B|nr:putative histone-lysine N-methyltransferase PRDM6 [Hydra vulgaris]